MEAEWGGGRESNNPYQSSTEFCHLDVVVSFQSGKAFRTTLFRPVSALYIVHAPQQDKLMWAKCHVVVARLLPASLVHCSSPSPAALPPRVLIPDGITEQLWKSWNFVFSLAICISEGQSCQNHCCCFLFCTHTRIMSGASVGDSERNAPLCVQLAEEGTLRGTGISDCTYGTKVFVTIPTFLMWDSLVLEVVHHFRFVCFFFPYHTAYGIHAAAHSNPCCLTGVPCSASARCAVKHKDTAGRMLPCTHIQCLFWQQISDINLWQWLQMN